MSIDINDKRCCGCSACVNVCPTESISMETDEFGFLTPTIDISKCLECGLCNDVCSINKVDYRYHSLFAYAASSIGLLSTNNSSSGGIFCELAELFINNGGSVFGTCMDEAFNVFVCEVTDLSDLHKILGSKYVQSDMDHIFRVIKERLDEGKMVLFGGTPCQISAIRRYLNRIDNNLLLVDLVCHGTPNNQLFKDYIRYYDYSKKVSIKEFKFRDKAFGQSTIGSVVYKHNNKTHKQKLSSYKSSYYHLYLRGLIFRESCYCCSFACDERVGDITLCDFWGIEKVRPDVAKTFRNNHTTAISGVLINTNQGSRYFDMIKHNLVVSSVEPDDIKAHNPQLNTPYHIDNAERKKVLSLYRSNGYCAVEKYYKRHYAFEIVRKHVASILPSFVSRSLILLRDTYLKKTD